MNYLYRIKFLLLLIPVMCVVTIAGRKYTSGAEMTGTNLSMPKMGANAVEFQSSTTFGGWGFAGADRTGNGHGSYGCFGNGAQQNASIVTVGTMTPPCYMRVWINTGTAPPAKCQILSISNNVDQNLELTWETNGHMTLTHLGVGSVTTAGVVQQSQWILVKLYTNWATSNDTDRITINGEVLEDHLAHNSTMPNSALIGFSGPETNPGTQCNFDDIAINDASGGNENTAPDDSAYVLWLPAVSDTAIGGWTAGAGSTSSLFEAVNNVPVTGVASASEDNTTNIKNSVSSASDNYDAGVISYQAAGVPANKTVRLAQAVVRHGENASTGTENGAVQLVSNPADAGETSFTFGGDAGAHVADATTSALLWRTTYGAIVYAPLINRTNRPVVRVGKRTANTNQVCVDMLGVMIEVGSAFSSSGKKFIIN